MTDMNNAFDADIQRVPTDPKKIFRERRKVADDTYIVVYGLRVYA